MSIQKVIFGYSKYNHWTNEQLSGWLVGLGEPFLYKETASSFANIALTVQHMQESQQYWLGHIAKKALVLADGKSENNINLLLEGSRLMLDTYGTYTEEELLETVRSTDMARSRYEFILHSINHNTYHRGQIVTMCRQLGIVDNIPAMDYDVFLWLSP